MRHWYSINFLVYFLIGALTSYAQFLPTSEYNLSVNAYGTNSPTVPFWYYANQYNVIPKNSSSFIARAALGNTKGDTVKYSWREIRLLYGLDGAFIAQQNSNAFKLIESFAGIKYGPIELFYGRRLETMGLLGDTLLSSGSYSWSGNAQPFPKVQLSVPNYIELPFFRGLFSVKGSFAHGWLDTLAVAYGQRTNAVKAYFHQKTLFIKMGRPNWKVNLIGGFNHLAQWGGEDQIWPDGLPPKEAWWAVVVGKPWQDSRVGNHLGTLDLGLVWKLANNKSLTFFRQNIFDDGSLYSFLNIKDGLQGVTFNNRNTPNYAQTFTLEKVNVEWLNTTSQGGNVFDFQKQIFGRDNYFNHYVYSEGWSYKGEMIGTPFIPKQSDIISSFPPIKNAKTLNNRIQMLHLGASGWIDEWKWLVKASFSNNLGTYDYPFPSPKQQFSSLIQIQKELPWLQGIDWTTSIAIDAGTLYEPSMGIQLGLRKRGFF